MSLRNLSLTAITHAGLVATLIAFVAHNRPLLAQAPPPPPSRPPLAEISPYIPAMRFESLPIQFRLTSVEQGRVTVETNISAAGEPVDARVISGPNGLRRRALLVVLAASVSRELAKRKTLSMTVEFVKHPARSMSPPSQPFEQAEYQGADYHSLSPVLLRRVEGVLAKVRTGQRLTDEQWSRIIKEVSALDSNLSVSRRTFSTAESATGFAVRLRVERFSALYPDFIRVMDLKLTNKPEPEYPPQARRAKIQGTVRFRVEVGKDGAVQAFELISGHPLLVPAAVSALRQYRYQPVRLDGDPVNVVTHVDINFVLTGR